MKSMTGYGYQGFQDEKTHITLEIKSYNNRYLDIIVNQPPYLNPLETRIREYLSGKVNRGRVEVYLRVRELEEDLKVILDKKAVKGYASVLKELGETAGITEPLHLSHFLKLDGVLKTERNRDIEEMWEKIKPLLDKASDEYTSSRKKEGNALKEDILQNLDIIKSRLSIFQSKAEELENRIKENIRERFHQVLEEKVDDSRILAETAVLLVKYSIGEEIVRLGAHIESFREIVQQGGPIGKKLDFLCQEVNREVNTIGSKSVIVEVNQAVVEAKDALEKIREQLRNVE